MQLASVPKLLTCSARRQDLIGLHKLRCEQTVKRIFEMDLKRATFCTLLSHAFVACRETLATRG